MIKLKSIFFQKDSNVQTTVSFQLAELQDDTYPTSLADKKFAELVSERSNGRIQIEVVTNGQLGEEADVVEKLQNGTIGFARVSIAPMAEYVDALNALMLPYLYKDDAHMWRVLDSSLGDEMLASVSDAGILGLAWYDSGARSFYFKDKVENLAQIEDKNIRVQTSSLMFAMCEAVSCNPMTGMENEIMQDIRIGTLDGAENNIPTYASFNQYEVCKYFLMDEHTRIPEILAGSEAALEGLSKEDLQMIQECAKETQEYEKEQWAEAEKQAKQMLVDKGVVFITLSDEERQKFIDVCVSLYDEFGSEYQAIIDQIKELE
jgi:tripartite ATP-independent transporter DctP family solute receptor